LSRLTRFHIAIQVDHGILEVQLLPPQRKALAIRSSARLHEQNDRNAKVRACCAEDSLFSIHGQHALRRSLPALVEMFHAGRRVLGGVFAIHRELEHALQVFECSLSAKSIVNRD
jgi:hypothetical protein